jgi:plastocyanin
MKNKAVLAVVGVVIILAIIFGVVALSGSKKDNTSSTTTSHMDMSNGSQASSSSSSKAVATDTVAIQNFAFSPETITVKVGTKVTWTNKDSAAHTVTGDNNDGPASGTLAQGASYSFIFSKVGTFNYECSIHPSMKGTVIVTN